jgi:AcrR family transcriptional regulator
MSPPARAADRAVTPRERHRLQTREEILDAALEVMAEQGVAGLNLTEVARRVGLRQPSLYQYFGSRNAVFDALFERGMRIHAALFAAAIERHGAGWAAVRAACWETVRFAAEQPELAELMFTRAVPGFTPSGEAYAPSMRVAELMQAAITAAAEHGEVHVAAASESGIALLMVMVGGVGSQHLANERGVEFTESRLLPLLDTALDMYAAYFSPDRPADWAPEPSALRW